MATIECAWCKKFMGYSIGLGYHGKGTKTFDDNWVCSNECKRDYNNGMRNNQNNIQNNPNLSAELANAEVEKQRLELEDQKRRDEKEAKEAADRKERGEKYRAEGKPLTAFLVETNPVYTLSALIIYITLFVIPKHGYTKVVLINGLLYLIGAIFIAFLIKDFSKIKGKPALFTILCISSIPLIITIVMIVMHSIKPEYKELSYNIHQTDSILNSEEKEIPIINAEINRNPEVQQKPENEEIKSNTDLAIGEWKGEFGKSNISLVIENINSDGSVSGYDIVKGNRRDLTGNYIEKDNILEFNLNEPGTDDWDGKFTFSIVDGIAKGFWEANNKKSTKNFILNK